MKKRWGSFVLVVVFIFSLCSFEVSAADNPYPKWQNIFGTGETVRCTHYAWQQVYDNLGIVLPGWGNAGTWLNSAKNAGYSTGTIPRAKSIVVWSDGGFGHVDYVTAVNGSNITVNGGGYHNSNNTPYYQAGQEAGVAIGMTKPSAVGSNYYGQTLIGYIYFDDKGSAASSSNITVTFTANDDKQNIGTNNATLARYLYVSGATIPDVTKIGFYLYDASGKELASASENVSYTSSYISMWYNIQEELQYTLMPGTKYQYRFYAVIKGKTYYGPMESFTTNGNSYLFDLNWNVDGAVDNTGAMHVATADIYINGNLDADDVRDYYKEWPQGTKYEIKDIKCEDGYEYKSASVPLSGTIDDVVSTAIYIVTKQVHVHRFNHYVAQAASCVHGGNIEYWYCRDCGKYFADEGATKETTENAVKIKPLGHNYVNGICTRDGAKDPNYKNNNTVHFEKFTIYFQGQFEDVPANQWFTDSVAEAFEFGLMQGNSKTIFDPYGDVTIAQAITMAARIHSIYSTGTESFEQNQGEYWYDTYKEYAYKNGIINRAFYNCDVTQKASRAQFAEIFANALPDSGLLAINNVNDNAIPDVKMSDGFAPYVYKLYRAGILTGGDAKGTFSPQTYITRAEAAAIVSRMAESDNRLSFTVK